MADAADQIVEAIERFVDAKIKLHAQSDPSRPESAKVDEARTALAMAINDALRKPFKGEREAE